MTVAKAVDRYIREIPNGENVINRQRLAIAMIDRLRDIRPKVDTGGDKNFIVHVEYLGQRQLPRYIKFLGGKKPYSVQMYGTKKRVNLQACKTLEEAVATRDEWLKQNRGTK